MALLPVDQALERILEGVESLDFVDLPLSQSAGRVLAADLHASQPQPPFNVSAMDGYALRAADTLIPPARLEVIGVSAAGKRFSGSIGTGQAVRIFTGAALPPGADSILIQEDARQISDHLVEAQIETMPGQHIRMAGFDFQAGDLLLERGRILDPAAISLAAAAGYAKLPIFIKPKIAILSTGDELVAPGGLCGPDQIIASNSYGIGAIAELDGCDVVDLGIVPDDVKAIQNALLIAEQAQVNIIVTLGGASVGDHDVTRDALLAAGMELDFWKIAMRPGKPMIFGRLGKTRIIGLPGNPVSSFVCAQIFLRPLIACFAGRTYTSDMRWAHLSAAMPQNKERQDYVRAVVTEDKSGLFATPLKVQDSAMLTNLAQANALIVRKPHAPAAKAGDPCDILMLR